MFISLEMWRAAVEAPISGTYLLELVIEYSRGGHKYNILVHAVSERFYLIVIVSQFPQPKAVKLTLAHHEPQRYPRSLLTESVD